MATYICTYLWRKNILIKTKGNLFKDKLSLLRTYILALIFPFLYDLSFYIIDTGFEFFIIPWILILSSIYYFFVSRESESDYYCHSAKKRRQVFFLVQIVSIIVIGIIAAYYKSKRGHDYASDPIYYKYGITPLWVMIELFLYEISVIIVGKFIMLYLALIDFISESIKPQK